MRPITLVSSNLICVVIVLTLLGNEARLVAAQNATSAQARDRRMIRNLIRQENDGRRVIKYTNEPIFVSGAYPRPLTGAQARSELRDDNRGKRTVRQEMIRLTISKSRDVAYDFGNFRMSYDDPEGKRVSLSGSYLRVWRKLVGKWKVDALFARPNRESQ